MATGSNSRRGRVGHGKGMTSFPNDVLFAHGTRALTVGARAAPYKWEPQRTNHFEIQFNTGIIHHEIALAVASFGLPTIANDPVEVPHVNHRIKFAGQAVFSGAETLEVVDFVGRDVEGMLYDWRLEVYNPWNDVMGLAANYKEEADVLEFAPDGEAIRAWRLEGVWPTTVSFGDSMTYDGSEVKRCNVTMAYDRGYRFDAHPGTFSAGGNWTGM